MLQRILEWDRETFIYLNSLGIERFDSFWSLATDIGTWIPLFVLFFVLLLWHFPRREALLMMLSVVLLSVFIVYATEFSKEFFGRLRPNNNTEINTLIRILRSPTNFSFFSGHAASSFSITTLVVLFLRDKTPWVWLFYLWPLIFSFSRIYVGVHYPTDILTGALVGILSALLFRLMYGKLIRPYLVSDHP